MSRSRAQAQPLAGTLAQRIQQLRESRGMTQQRLAEAANLPLNQIQDIEAGIELFLSPSVRQKLARVLKVRPSTLQSVEKFIPPLQPALSQEAREQMIEEILRYPNEVYACPLCGETLAVRIFNRRDLEDNLLVEVKANCLKCLFRI